MKEAQGDPIKMSRLVNNIVQSIAVIPDEITRVFYTRETAQMMQLKEDLVSSAVTRQLNANAQEMQKEREREQRRAQQGTSQMSEPTDSPQVPVEATTPPEEIPVHSVSSAPAQPPAIETLIIQSVIRYGERIICDMQQADGSTRPITVIEYVEGSLSQDRLTFTWPLYQQVLELGMAHCGEEGFKAAPFYLNHPDKAISELAFRLGTDAEPLSRYHTQGVQPDVQEEYNLLMDLVTRLLTDLKLSIVTQRRKHLTQQMRDPAVLADRERTRNIMLQLQELKALEALFAKQCGDRVLGL